VIFEYYKECGGYINDIMTFGRLFQEILNRGYVNTKVGGVVRVNNESARSKIHQHYNTKFGL
jgi:hypothetical protein